jgi:hypothetical protein
MVTYMVFTYFIITLAMLLLLLLFNGFVAGSALDNDAMRVLSFFGIFAAIGLWIWIFIDGSIDIGIFLEPTYLLVLGALIYFVGRHITIKGDDERSDALGILTVYAIVINAIALSMIAAGLVMLLPF